MNEIDMDLLIRFLSFMVQLVGLIYQIVRDKRKSRHYSE